MKETLTVKKVKTMEELVNQYDLCSKFTAAFVEELNAYAVAIACVTSRNVFIGHSAIKSGGALKNVLIKGRYSDRLDYCIYVAYEPEIEIYSLTGDMFGQYGFHITFDFTNETVDTKNIEDDIYEEIVEFVQSKPYSCALE
jgi:hypothetical protein